jgi:hypothetical protein
MTLADIQEASYRLADRALVTSWPRDRMMSAEALDRFLDDRRYCVLATTAKNGHPQARPVGFAVVDEAIWFATVAGGRLRNLGRVPWTSIVVMDGEGDAHRAVAADGPVKLHEAAPARGGRGLAGSLRPAPGMGRRLVRAPPESAVLVRAQA